MWNKNEVRQKCWANSLGSCSGGWSKEHYFSECILGDHIEAYGFDWTGNKKVTIPTSSATAKILCKHHNEKLSVLDEQIKKIRDEIKSFFQQAGKYKDHDPKVKRTFSVNGSMFERWLLKTALNCLILCRKKILLFPAPTLPCRTNFWFNEIRLLQSYGPLLGSPGCLSQSTAGCAFHNVQAGICNGKRPVSLVGRDGFGV